MDIKTTIVLMAIAIVLGILYLMPFMLLHKVRDNMNNLLENYESDSDENEENEETQLQEQV